jgi:hypothetical protein
LLQHKLAEHFRKKKADDARQDYDKTANDQDSKYVKYMGTFRMKLDFTVASSMFVGDHYS